MHPTNSVIDTGSRWACRERERERVHCCLQHRATRYLTDYCVPVSEVPGQQRLRSARRRQLSVPSVFAAACFVTFGSRAFSVAAPTVWNSLPDDLHDRDSEHLMQNLKTHLFNGYFSERLAYYKCLTLSRYTNRHLLTYLLCSFLFCVLVYQAPS